LNTEQLLQQPAVSEVGGMARSGALWTLGMIAGRYGVSLIATAFLARLLTPTDYGLMGMVATLTTFLLVFSDMGLGWATVQKKDLSLPQVNNLFWTNAAAGALLWFACGVAGPLLNRFYGRQELAGVVAALGGGFLLSSLAVQPMALLRRSMRLKSIALIEIGAAASGACVGVALALAGFGYWALVGQSLAQQFTLLLALFAHTRYVPGMPRGNQNTLGMLRLGGYLAAYGIVNYFAFNLDNVLIGRVWGAEQLGYYSRAYFLMLLPTYIAAGSLMGVTVPAMSRLFDDRVRMASVYRKAVATIGLFSFPLGVGLAVTAPEAIRLVYGTKWQPVAPLLFWLSIAGIALPIHNTLGWLYIAAGKAKQMFFWGLGEALVLSLGFWWGVQWGASGVAITYALLMLFALTIPALFLAHRAAALSMLQTVSTLKTPFLASLVMGLAVWVSGEILVSTGVGWGAILCVKVAIGVLVYALLCRPDLTRFGADAAAHIRGLALAR
jgi:O-antigen/teichoic acid export membrane protein